MAKQQYEICLDTAFRDIKTVAIEGEKLSEKIKDILSRVASDKEYDEHTPEDFTQLLLHSDILVNDMLLNERMEHIVLSFADIKPECQVKGKRRLI